MSGPPQFLEKAIDDDQRLPLRMLNLLDTPPEKSFDRITNLATQLTKAPMAMITFIDAERQFFKSCIGLPEQVARAQETPLNMSIAKFVAADQTPIIIEDARRLLNFKEHPAVVELGWIAYAGVPLKLESGHAIGALEVAESEPRRWDPVDLHALQELAELVITEIELRRVTSLRTRLEAKLSGGRDMTSNSGNRLEIKPVETRFRQVEIRDRLRTKFIADITHDLKNPITSLNLYAGLLKKGRPENQDHYIDLLSRESRRLKALIEMVSEYNRVSDQTEFVLFDLKQLVRRETERLDSLFKEGVVLELQSDDSPLWIVGEKNLLTLMVKQILSNALRHTQVGKIIAICQLTIKGSTPLAMLQFSNCGVPLVEERTAEQLAEAEEGMTEARGGYSGFGLGLGAVREVVQLHNGEIEIDSKIGQDTTLTIYLPLEEGVSNPRISE